MSRDRTRVLQPYQNNTAVKISLSVSPLLVVSNCWHTNYWTLSWELAAQMLASFRIPKIKCSYATATSNEAVSIQGKTQGSLRWKLNSVKILHIWLLLGNHYIWSTKPDYKGAMMSGLDHSSLKIRSCFPRYSPLTVSWFVAITVDFKTGGRHAPTWTHAFVDLYHGKSNKKKIGINSRHIATKICYRYLGLPKVNPGVGNLTQRRIDWQIGNINLPSLPSNLLYSLRNVDRDSRLCLKFLIQRVSFINTHD